MKPARNLPRSPLTAAERLAAFLKPRPLSAFNVPVNTGPLNVRRAGGALKTI